MFVKLPYLLFSQFRQRKAERLERQRDDPYYIQDPILVKPPTHDVDAIPVVHLDLPLLKGTRAHQKILHPY